LTLMPKLIVVSNRLPVSLKPDEDALDLAEKKVRECEAVVADLQKKRDKLNRSIEEKMQDSCPASRPQSRPQSPRGEREPVPTTSEYEIQSCAGTVQDQEQDSIGKGEALSFFEFRDALKSLGPLSAGVAVEDLVTELRWKGWVGVARAQEGSALPEDASTEGDVREERGKITYEDFAQIWQDEDQNSEERGKIKLGARFQTALMWYGGPEQAWRALHGSVSARLLASQRGIDEAEKSLAQAREEMEWERRNPTAPIKPSSGGLVSAMRSISSAGKEGKALLWVGWPGSGLMDEDKRDRYRKVLQQDLGYFPVYLTDDEADAFYTGFSNTSLWPLLHWMTPYAHYSAAWTDAYRRVNGIFADAIIDAMKEEGTRSDEFLIWVHDYHLFLVPQMLRERANDFGFDVKIAFFLHTPFPGYEIICCHPNCSEILDGVLASDLIGFHTYGYLRHFRSAVTRIFGYGTEMDHIDHDGLRTKLGVFPIGVDKTRIEETMQTKEFEQYLKSYEFHDQALVLSVERLDYSKGIPQKLAAIKRFLEITRESGCGDGEANNGYEFDPSILQRGFSWFKSKLAKPQSLWWNPRNTTFLFVSVPSRQEVEEYKAMERDVHNTISEINGKFSTPTHTPIIYMHRSVPFPELVALYARADCCLVTPLIDGMNLVAKEFVAAKDQKIPGVVPGLVVLSELAGAAQEMFDALVVNPHDIEKVARSIIMALEMPRDERWQFTTDMRKAVIKNDARAWAHNVLKELKGVIEKEFPLDRLENLPSMLSVSNQGRFSADSDWSEPGQKSAIKLNMVLVEVNGEPLPESIRSMDSLIEFLSRPELSASGVVTLGFSDFSRLPRSASRSVLPLETVQVARDFTPSVRGQKALFLDYDGTLRKFADRAEEAVPDEELKQVLELLNARPDLEVFIVSGRTPVFMEEHFMQYERITLVAEHGFSVCMPGEEPRTFKRFNRHTRVDWMDQVLPVMELFERSTPGSKVEVKTSALVWHYRKVDPEYGEFKAKELTHTLWQSVANLPCEVSRGNMIVEVASLQVKKGLVVKHFLDERKANGLEPYSCAICIGDDRTDETMFHYVQEEGRAEHEGLVTVKVGRGNTYAGNTLKDPAAVVAFLRLLATDNGGVDSTLQEALPDPMAPDSENEKENNEKDEKSEKDEAMLVTTLSTE